MWQMIPIALFGFLFLTLFLYASFPPQRAMLTALVIGVIFLPVAGYDFPIIRTYDRNTAVSISILLAVFLFDAQRLSKFRFSWIDLPMLVWCLVPFVSSLTNDLGFYDGLAETELQILIWGIPYFLGRIYFRDLPSMYAFAIALVWAGVITTPFCIIESLRGPLFHAKVYGFYPHDYWQQVRYGGWRPSVFMTHGLTLAWLMAMATMAALWLYAGKTLPKIFSIPASITAIGLVVVTFYCRSTGALVVLAGGMVPLYFKRFRWSILICLIVATAFYAPLRITGAWSGTEVVDWSQKLGDDRASSIQARFTLEGPIIAHALERPFFGWAGWGRSTDGTGAWTEGIWTVAIGRYGLVGLVAWFGMYLIPASVALKYLRQRQLTSRALAPVNCLIVLMPMIVVYGIVVVDFSPLNGVLNGALASLAVGLYRREPAFRFAFAESPSRAVNRTSPRQQGFPLPQLAEGRIPDYPRPNPKNYLPAEPRVVVQSRRK